MKEEQDRLEYLIHQYENNSASESEEKELFTIIDQAKNDKDIKEIMLRLLESQVPSELNRPKWDSVLAAVFKEEEDIHPASAPVYSLFQRTKVFSWKKMAAAVVLILLVGATLFYFLFSGNNDNRIVMQEPLKAAPSDITSPGSVKATLTLSNGQTIMLDSAGNGVLAQEGAADVIKLADGQIAYNSQGGTNKVNEVLYNTITNPAGSKVINITLEDGTKVWLNSKSSLRYPTVFSGKERRVKITGEAYFEVAHLISGAEGKGNAAIPFHVSVGGVDVEVLGTHFNINSYPEEGAIKTTLFEGSVRIHEGKNAIMLKPGQQAEVNETIGSKNDPITINVPDLDEVLAWKNGRFYYNNTDLGTIMRQIARWYDVEVVYRDTISDHYTVNVLRDVPVSRIFKFIEMTGGVHFKIEGKTIVVTK